jgi:hypothetical protein
MQTRIHILLAGISTAAMNLGGSTAFAQATKTVAISGSVVDDSGALVGGAKVYYNNSPTIVTDRAGHTTVTGPVVNSSSVTGQDGTFSVTGLPSGVYWLCAEGTQATQIRSCDWGFDATKVDLTKVSSANNAKLQVHDGVTVTFQVNDARNQIKDFSTDLAKPAPPGNFRIFLVDGARLRPAQPVSVSGAMHQYTLVVPKTRAVRLLLDTKLNVLNQTQSAALPGKLGDTITVSGQPVTYNLTVQ